MRRLLLLLLFLAVPMRAEEHVQLAAAFTDAGAVISWQQPAGIYQTCLVRYYSAPDPAGICLRDLPEGPTQIELPGIYDPRYYTPADGDRYELWIGGKAVDSTTLGQARVYRVFLSLLLYSRAPPPANLAARWIGPGRAVVTWTGAGCLYRNETLLACYPREASYMVETPATAGDVFVLEQGEWETRVGVMAVAYLARI